MTNKTERYLTDIMCIIFSTQDLNGSVVSHHRFSMAFSYSFIVFYSIPVDSSESNNEKLSKHADPKLKPDLGLGPNPREKMCTEISTLPYLSPVQAVKSGHATQSVATSKSSPQSGQDLSITEQCFCLPYMSPHREHNHPNSKSSGAGTHPVCALPPPPRRISHCSSRLPSYPPSLAAPPPPPPTVPPPPPNQCIHPYEFYDHFGSTAGVSRQTRWSQPRVMEMKNATLLPSQTKKQSVSVNKGACNYQIIFL